MTLLDALRAQAATRPDAVALLAPDRAPRTYAQLVHDIEALAARVRAAHAGVDDCVVVVLPNGADLALACLATMTAAMCAPLAVDLPRAQYRDEFDRLRPALVVAGDDQHVVHDVAAERGLPILTWTVPRDGVVFDEEHDPGRVALVLSTSGTTSRPKVVPLRDAQLRASATNVATTLQLTADDRGLVLMPLSHIHGLVAGLLAPLLAGGSVVCTPGFRADRFLAWLDQCRPTWYTAVPTIHQAVLDVVTSPGVDVKGRLRFVRSSSASLPVRVLEQLEAAFAAPVVEAYGMTEAAHQMTSNPLPPAVRKPGTVGIPAGPEVTVLATTGEIVIRGETVIQGYADDPDATAAAFTKDGWFRTGDLGRVDDDGYLTITGRIKELINRGGEKVAPREVEDVLLSHPDVVHAVAFAVPHPRLGEEVGAAVVLRAGATVTAPQLRMLLAHRVAPYKVPRRVVAVDELPRGRTGKLQRTGLAAALGLEPSAGTARPRPAPPADDLEARVADIWQRVLALDERPGVDEDFFDLGGDSLHASEVLFAIADELGVHVPATVFFDGASVRTMADAVRVPRPTADEIAVVDVQPDGDQAPLCCLLRGGSVVIARHFARALERQRPVLGLWAPRMHGRRGDAGSIEEIAAECVTALRAARPHGPYVLFGHSLGGVVMYETAQQLTRAGERVDRLVLADAVHPDVTRREHDRRHSTVYRARKLFSRKGPSVIAFRVRRALGRLPERPAAYVPGSDVVLDWSAASERERNYDPVPATFPVTVLATRGYLDLAGPTLGWAPVLSPPYDVHEVPGDHNTMLGEPHVHVLAAEVQRAIGRPTG